MWMEVAAEAVNLVPVVTKSHDLGIFSVPPGWGMRYD
jgi:hypothetical protein